MPNLNKRHRLETVHARNLADHGTISILNSKAQNNFERQGDSPTKPTKTQKTLSYSTLKTDLFNAEILNFHGLVKNNHSQQKNINCGYFWFIPICDFFSHCQELTIKQAPTHHFFFAVKNSFRRTGTHLDIVWAHTIHLKIQFLKILAKLLQNRGDRQGCTPVPYICPR